jgi:23S rRNA maturation mini-RNase III
LLFAEGVESTQISGKEKDLLTDEALNSPGEACGWKVKSGCAEPRLICVGVADFNEVTNPSIRIAYKFAKKDARQEMLKTFQNAKNIEKCTDQISKYTKPNAGDKNSEQSGDFCRNEFSTFSEAFIGYTTLASEIDKNEKTVKVVLGRECQIKDEKNFKVQKYRSKDY